VAVAVAVVLLAGLLAAVNGANDVANGVATLAGSRVAGYRLGRLRHRHHAGRGVV
jgi:phosphate/sulfate permease